MGPSGDNVEVEVERRDAMDSAIAAWRGDPASRRALAAVRAGLAVRHANAILSGAQGVGELARAAANLLARIRDGTVQPNRAVVDALAAAASRVADPGPVPGDGGVDDQVERLDAYASGLTDLEFGDLRPEGASIRREPPLLTLRHDGVRVQPGSFGTPSGDSGPQAGVLPILVDASEAIADHIRGQIETVLAVAGENAVPELRRLATDLQDAVDNVETLNRTLAEYARRVGER